VGNAVSPLGSSLFVSGAITMGYVVAAIFFLRYWRDTRDRLFLFFTTAFVLLAAQRTALSFIVEREALVVGSYGLRLLAFVIILVGIVDKNRR
jgi:hypothetical protein